MSTLMAKRPKRTKKRPVAGIRLFLILPTRAPGVPLQGILESLEISESTFFRILRDWTEAGVQIESACLPDGHKGYWASDIIRRLLKKWGLDERGGPVKG